MNTGNGPFGPIVNGTQIVFFEYRSNKSGGYTFTALFAFASVGHLIYLIWRRAWFFIPFLLGGISKTLYMNFFYNVSNDLFPAETFGYYGRAMASDNPEKVGPFIIQNLLILVATPFLAASVYMSLGRIIIALDAQRHSIINIRWMTKIYVLIDFGCIVSQFIGASLPASGDPASIKNDRIILLSGLITQVIATCLMVGTVKRATGGLLGWSCRFVMEGRIEGCVRTSWYRLY